MNPINDEIPSKDSTEAEKNSENSKEIKLGEGNEKKINDSMKKTAIDTNLNEQNENKEERIKNYDQTENTKSDKILPSEEASKESNLLDTKMNTEIIKENPEEEQSKTEIVNENSYEREVYEKDKKSAEKMKEIIAESDLKSNKNLETDLKAQDFEDLNKKTATVSEPATEDEIEEIENVEDVEIPDEEDVDEIIVPDEAEAEDLTDEKDQNEETENSQNGEAEDEEEQQSAKESEVEDNESEANLHEPEEESSEALEKDEEDDGENDKKSVNTDTKDDYEDPADLVILDEIANAESCKKQTKSEQTDLDEDTTTQTSFDPLNCTDNKEPNDDDDKDNDNVSVKNAESENSNGSHQSQEKDENEEVKSTKNIESGNENSVESQNQTRNENEENDEDDEVQFVETRNSPICIESDDEDTAANTNDTNATTSLSSANINHNNNDGNRRIITTATTTVTVPKNITVTRTSARKSTAKPPQNQPRTSNSPSSTAATAGIVSQIQNRAKNLLQKSSTFNMRTFTGACTQKIVDCIELLDSSDDETSSKTSRPQQQRTPQKRTLLAAKGNFYKNSNNSKTTNPVLNRLPHNFTPQIRQQPKKPAPPPLPPPTPQSNFLNAVQLQPAAITGANPPAFSALLSNKNVIIPNAFYGNPPSIRGTSCNETEAEKRSVRWLENFLNQFCKPQFEPTHSCFVFLQRALKYKDFVRIKALRTSMNSHVQNASNQLNIDLMTDLKTIFFKNVKRITNYGQRFCELTCTTTAGKAVTLITHRLSGKVTLKTCNMELPKPANSSNSATNTATSSQASTNTSAARKRQLDEDEDEYTPDKSLYKSKGKPPSENGDDDSGDTGDDRKRSLRTKRTKRIDNSFSYNEDDLLAEYEINDADDEKLAQVEIERKIEQKRLEAQQQRQQQVKSFESAFIQAFAKTTDAPTTSTKTKYNTPNQRIRLKNTTTATVSNIRQYTANNDAEDLLQATWIENYENDNNTQVISDDDEPQVHRIYKQQEELQNEKEYYKLPSNLTISKITPTATVKPNPRNTGRATKRTASRNYQEEFITGDDDYVENNHYANNSLNGVPLVWPKNVDPHMTVTGKNKDRCVICSLNCQRLVHHYVNEHRGCETYNSRLSATQIKKLKQGNCTATVSLYKNGQSLYEAFCIFCNKISRFMLRYWYQHYTMHTGEYAYRCTGCGIRKPTQSLLTLHHSQGCPEVVGGTIQDYIYDSKIMQIDAKICSICNYLQLHRSNIVKHLHTQHNIKQILPKHILTVALMKIPAHLAIGTSSSSTNTPANPYRRSFNTRSSSAAYSSTSSSSTPNDTFVIEDVDNDNTNYEEILPEQPSQPPPQNHYYNYIPPYMQAAFESGNLTFENVEAGDDLSFTICGMLDVQMNANNDAD